MRKLVVFLLAVAIGIGGVVLFTSKGSDNIIKTVAVTPTVVKTAEERMTIQQAASLYESYVASSNKAMYAMDKACSYRTQLLASCKKAALRYRDAMRVFISQLLKTDWPIEIKATVEEVAKEASPDISYADAVAKAKTFEEFANAWSAPTASNAAAQRLRIQLGLGVAE